jgi:hypothetical protein
MREIIPLCLIVYYICCKIEKALQYSEIEVTKNAEPSRSGERSNKYFFEGQQGKKRLVEWFLNSVMDKETDEQVGAIR